MTASDWHLDEDRASEMEILAHLQRCDARFVPPLSTRVDLPTYAHRLYTRARRFEAWADDSMIGLLASYLDNGGGTAFISNVSVEEGFLGCGVASTLLAQMIACAGMEGLTHVRLHVNTANVAAQNLYEKHGFRTCTGAGEQMLMQLDLLGMNR